MKGAKASWFDAMAPITRSEAQRLYKARNDACAGFSLGSEDDTVDDAAAGLAEEGRDVILRATRPGEVYAVRTGSDEIVLVGGDASGCSPWGVAITAEMLSNLREDA